MKSYFIALTAAIGGFLFGYNIAIMSGAILFIQTQFHLTSNQTEIVIASFLFGAIFGALASGKGVGLLGRKKMLILTAFFFLIGTSVTTIANTMSIMVLGRIIIGCGIGSASMVVPLYIAEISPPARRGFFVSFNQLMITGGMCVAYFINLAFAHHELWQYMLGIGFLPAALLGSGMFFLPESPRWLIRKGFEKRAKAILFALHPPQLAELEFNEVKNSLKEQIKTESIFHKKYFLSILIGVTLAIFQQITGINTIIYYAPIIFKMTGFESNIIAILATAGLGIVNFAMTLVAIQLIDRIGRRPLLLIGVGGMLISLFSLGLSFYFAAPSQLLGWLATLCLVIYIASFAIGLGPIFWLLISEIYPFSIRGKAMSLATITNWSANLLVAITFLTLIGRLGQTYTFWLYGLITIGCWFFVFFLVPETKGKRLEEIEKFWT